MAESLICKRDKRVIFCLGGQSRFLAEATKKLKLSWSEFAEKIGLNKRVLSDWRREKYSLPLNVLKKICIITKSKMPVGIEIKDPFWYVPKAAKIGGFAVYKKYGIIGGNQEYRKKKWSEWWEKIGRLNHNKYFIAKEIFKPKKSVDLAEFVGIMMGDGGISNNQVIVTLSLKNDKPYSIFVVNLVKKLFDISPSIYLRKEESVINIVVSRINLVYFCKSIGLKIGNKLKQNLDIPEWIKGDKSLEISCIRGLVDTDGCVFNECHKIKGKKYCYLRLAFTSYSKRLCASVFKIFKEIGFKPKIRNNRNVQLENKEDILKYLQLVNTHNLHHKERFKLFLEG